jgi:GNAT superfamily N-acetyltransferase
MKFVSKYLHEKPLLELYNNFTSAVFGAHVAEIEYAYDDLIPFSFYSNDQIIANISIQSFTFTSYNKKYPAFFIHSVGVVPEYQGQGLIKKLFSIVTDYIKNQNGISCLYADPSVESFYSKFNLKKTTVPQSFIATAPRQSCFEKPLFPISFENTPVTNHLKNLLRNRSAASFYAGAENLGDSTFYFLKCYYLHNVYFIESLDTFVVIKADRNQLTVTDIISREIPFMEIIFPHIGSSEISSIVYRFTPDRICTSYQPFEFFSYEQLLISHNFPSIDEPFCLPEIIRGL